MRNAPNIIHLNQNWLASLNEVQAGIKDVNGLVLWVPARAVGYFSISSRLKAAWMVFTGKADALVWPLGQ